MTLQSFVGSVAFPPLPHDLTLPIRSETITGGSGHALGTIFRCPKDGEIRKIHFLINSITSSGTIDVRLETVSTTNGDPTGTLVDTNSNLSSTFSATGWVNSGNFTGDATVTKGQVVAVVLDAGTFDGVIGLSDPMYGTTSAQLTAYSSLFNGSVWEKDDPAMLMAVEYATADDIIPIPGLYSFEIRTNFVFNNTDDPDIVGMKFQLTFPARLVGVWATIEVDANVDIHFYSSGTTIATTISLDKDQRFSSFDTMNFLYFSTPQTLVENTDYRVAIEPTEASDISIQKYTYNSATMLKAQDGGTAFHLTEKKDAGWTDETAERIHMGILLDQFGDDTGGGSVSVECHNPIITINREVVAY